MGRARGLASLMPTSNQEAAEGKVAEKEDAAEEETAIVNHIAIRGIKLEDQAVSRKRKRHEETLVEGAPPKPAKLGRPKKIQKASSSLTATESSGKLTRPTASSQSRQMSGIRPALAPTVKAKVVSGDVYEVPEDPPGPEADKTTRKIKSKSGTKTWGPSKRKFNVIPARKAQAPGNEGTLSADSDEQTNTDEDFLRVKEGSRGNKQASSPAVQRLGAGRQSGSQRPNEGKKRSSKAASQRTPKSGLDGAANTREHDGTDGLHDSEDEGSNHDNLSQSEVEVEHEDQQAIDFLGQEKEWKKVLKNARYVGGKMLRANLPVTFKTNTIEDLVADIQEARSNYDELRDAKGADHSQLQGLFLRLDTTLTEIEDQLAKDVTEKKAANKASEMIYDIYRRAIPAAVLLLEKGLNFHADSANAFRDVKILREVVRLLDIAVSLGEKQKFWKAKPRTELPILKPTKQVMYPYLRGMRKVFAAERDIQEKKLRHEENNLRSEKAAEEKAEEMRQRRETSSQNLSQRNVRICQNIQRNRELFREHMFGFDFPSREELFEPKTLSAVQPSASPQVKNKWTEEQSTALMKQLRVGYIPGQSALDRNLAMLNEPLLQEKLPEHVREEALALKPYMLEVHGKFEWIESIE
ncbi:hypothetical protein MMC21_000934 [Puttea exsequens]|nr:hypothetical protein [Puttea exsequens]